ncbi:MAG: hypothetical protein NVSMB9_14730 [Isosphaeraceae bacterium]
MFKRAFRVAITFGLLLAGYSAYVRVFALATQAISQTSRAPIAPEGKFESKTVRKAVDLAAHCFGAESWAASKDVPIRINDSQRGFYIYARDYKRLGKGEQIELRPFAMIWRSNDGQSFKTATSNVARLDLDKPLSLMSKPGTSHHLRVVHARLEDDVRLRDGKGTLNPLDDLRIGPLTYLEFDEANLQITSESDVLIEDSSYRITGTGLLIKLRPRAEGPAPPQVVGPGPGTGTGTGFNGAETAFLQKNVHIILHDVGPGGILPGNSGVARRPGEAVPLDLRCDGAMQIDLPIPRLPVRVGPPAPPSPTLAQFSRNVEVIRGRPDRTPDQLNCDHLRLVLIQGEKTLIVKPAAVPGEKEGAGPPASPMAGTGGLVLQRATASGHNVRLLSPAQGVKARCNELIHKKFLPDAPDETFFRGDPTSRLIVEKQEVVQDGPEKGKITSFTTIRTIDATIFDDGRGNENATIVARGPGELETRPAADKPVERTAHWLDKLTIQPEAPRVSKPGATGAQVVVASTPARAGKKITLTGQPRFHDLPAATSLSASRTTVIWLAPRSSSGQTTTRPGPGVGPNASPGAGAFDIEMLTAIGDVELNAPGKSLKAHQKLDAVFEIPPPGAPSSAPREAVVDAKVDANTTPDAPKKPARAAPDRPVEPEAKASADRVWARVLLQPSSGADSGRDPNASGGLALLGGGQNGARKAEIDTVYLRGGVLFDQDPPPGKTRGTHVAGEALDLINQGVDPATRQSKGTRFIVFHRDPETLAGSNRAEHETPARTGDLPPSASAESDPDKATLARVETDELTIRGKVIGFDQGTDQAWVDGRGSLTQLAARGFLSDKGLANAPAPSANRQGQAPRAKDPASTPAPVEKTPMTIAFARGMKFFGQSTDPQGKPAARAEFYKDVHAETEDASIACAEVMKTYFDQVVKLARPTRVPKPGGAEGELSEPAEPKPSLALIECTRQVVVINRKLDPVSKAVLQKQKILCEFLTYDRATGQFRVPGEGEVYLYEREGQESSSGLIPGRSAARATIQPTSGTAPGQAPATRRATAVVGRNGSDRARVRGQGLNQAPARPLPPLVLTQIHFTHEMRGRFGTGKETDKTETRWADFFGDVETIRARVGDSRGVLDADSPPDDARFITAQTLRVVSEPQRPTLKTADPPPRYLLRAWENATATAEDKTIQADIITYDSFTNLFYAYGEEGREILITQQDQVGQPPTQARGRALMFNARDGQSQLIEPSVMAALDARTGYRPAPAKPADTTIKPKRQRRTQFRNPRNIERKDFTGR